MLNGAPTSVGFSAFCFRPSPSDQRDFPSQTCDFSSGNPNHPMEKRNIPVENPNFPSAPADFPLENPDFRLKNSDSPSSQRPRTFHPTCFLPASALWLEDTGSCLEDARTQLKWARQTTQPHASCKHPTKTGVFIASPRPPQSSLSMPFERSLRLVSC